jgi:hypothetical protein
MTAPGNYPGDEFFETCCKRASQCANALKNLTIMRSVFWIFRERIRVNDEMRRRKNIFVIERRREIEAFFADGSRSTMIEFAVIDGSYEFHA